MKKALVAILFGTNLFIACGAYIITTEDGSHTLNWNNEDDVKLIQELRRVTH